MKKDVSTLIFSSAEDSVYGWWQNEVLYYTYKKVKQEGDFLAAISRRFRETPCFNLDGPYEDINFVPSCDYISCKNYRFISKGLDYRPYNKPAAMLELLDSGKANKYDQIMVVDPDFVFVKPFMYVARPRRPYAQFYRYLSPEWDRTKFAAKRHLKNKKADLDPVGVPVIMRTEDMAELAPGWLQKTIDLVEDPRCTHRIGWIVEMIGYMLAAAELGLKHTQRNMIDHTWSNTVTAPCIHYCDNPTSLRYRWQFDKRHYVPWTNPLENEKIRFQDLPKSSRFVLNTINEYAELQSYQIVDDKNRKW